MRTAIRQMSLGAAHFNSYQRARFPLVILTLSLIPATLSSGAVVGGHVGLLKTAIAVIASVAYLLHIRIIDERRDFSHDSLHHGDRPLQVGIISKRELGHIGIFSIAILLIAALAAGKSAIYIAFVMLAYTYLAGKEFFLGDKLRRHFFIYNSVNLVQMLLMQIFVYTIFAPVLSLSTLVLLHFIFTSVGTLTFEFIRKLKTPGKDGTGRDTYTWYLGFNGCLAVYEILLLAEMALFVSLAKHATGVGYWIVLSALLMAALASLANILHKIKKTTQTEQLMQLTFMLVYGICNLVIYFIILK